MRWQVNNVYGWSLSIWILLSYLTVRTLKTSNRSKLSELSKLFSLSDLSLVSHCYFSFLNSSRVHGFGWCKLLYLEVPFLHLPTRVPDEIRFSFILPSYIKLYPVWLEMCGSPLSVAAAVELPGYVSIAETRSQSICGTSANFEKFTVDNESDDFYGFREARSYTAFEGLNWSFMVTSKW